MVLTGSSIIDAQAIASHPLKPKDTHPVIIAIFNLDLSQ
jgi:hypothetical protein